MRTPRVAVVLGLGVLLSLAPREAFCEEEAPPRPRPTAPDTRAHRPTLAVQFGLQRPFGSADASLAQGDVVGWGQAPSLQLAYPLRRDFAIELWGSYGTYGAASGCSGCEGKSIAAGIGGVFHLVDGIPFDPWFSAGLGFRQTSLTTSTRTKIDFSGIDIPRLALGSDYYPAPFIGFGPFFEIIPGRFLTRSPGKLDEGATHGTFTLGLRVVLSPF